MLKIDKNLLSDLGLDDLSADDQNLMCRHIYETLERRVGERLAQQMSDEQLDEFDALVGDDDDGATMSWLEKVIPDYKETVHVVFENLKEEIAAEAPQIVKEASGAAK